MEKNYVKLILIFLFLTPSMAKSQQVPLAGKGQIFFSQKFKSKFVAERDIAVWVPNDYSKKKRYAVLYMHDGQMLFDSSITWNHQEWGVDESVQELIDQKKIIDCIVVGIYNGGTERHREFCPQKPFESLPVQYQDSLIHLSKRQNGNNIFSGKVISDDYLKFIVKELKPHIDKQFNTYKDQSHTFIGGSSMGGLISIYAICEYPEVFGGAICMSTHWPLSFTVENNLFPKAMFDYLKQKLPSSSNHKIYFDYGDQTLDAIYGEFQKQADAVMIERGYSTEKWKTNFFKGDDHSERSWKKRLPIALEFIMKE
jgi:predicted alpha/beta superfamily hydrolase